MGRRKIHKSEWDEKLKELYQAGLSLYQIYKLYGIHPQTTKERLANLGVKLRDPEEARESMKRRRHGKK